MTSNLSSKNGLKFIQEPGFFDRSLGVRLLIGLFFLFSFTLFLHIRETPIKFLELNTPASNYIIAEVDFIFPDEEATIIQKQEAVRDVGAIYKIQEAEIAKRRESFQKKLSENQNWRQQTEKSTFDELSRAYHLFSDALLKIRFTDARTLQKMFELSLPTDNYLIFTPASIAEPHFLPNDIWDKIDHIAFARERFSLDTRHFIKEQVKAEGWLLTDDLNAQTVIRHRIQSQIPTKYTQVSAGSRLIDQGEKVTSRHIAMQKAMQEVLQTRKEVSSPFTILGSFSFALLLTLLAIIYLYYYYPEVLLSNRKLFLLVTILLLTMALAKVSELFLLATQTAWAESVRYPLFVPFAAILLSHLMNPVIATFVALFLTLILAITLSFPWQGFVILNLVTALVAILSARSLHRRKEIFVVCGKAFLTAALVLIIFHLYKATRFDGFGADLITAAAFLALTAVLVVGLLPLLESGFRIMTDISLMEYMDPNQELLRRLSIEAPGTYQHSVIVGNLAEAAAQAIGANGLFCRVAAMYHDIGKLITPQYFTENQHGGLNPHQLLTPEESAQAIIAHVYEGIAMARKADLPPQIIEILMEHHGTTPTRYFLQKQIDRMEGDSSKIDESIFRYSGPRPRSREAAIIMIADSLEAASRSLEKIEEKTISELVQRVIRDKMDDGQFDKCDMTLEELKIVEDTLIRTLLAYGHPRIKYPRFDLGEETLRA